MTQSMFAVSAVIKMTAFIQRKGTFKVGTIINILFPFSF